MTMLPRNKGEKILLYRSEDYPQVFKMQTLSQLYCLTLLPDIYEVFISYIWEEIYKQRKQPELSLGLIKTS